MKKILIIGAFSFGILDIGGQPVKTRTLYYTLCSALGKENVLYLETKNWKKNPLRLLFNFKKSAKQCNRIMILPAKNGIEVFSRLVLLHKKKGDKIYYNVIGGWLPEKTLKEKRLRSVLKKFDVIFVETSTMKSDLEQQGFNNIITLPNFKSISILKPEELSYQTQKPLRLCTFSRVMKEKGIEDAVKAVEEINTEFGETVYTLDIYGQIDQNYIEQFERIKNNFPEYISYKGVIEPNDSVATLKDYFALLFPTHFFTEGIPGTIIDAYSAGVPVITSLWKNYSDIFQEKITGLGYQFNTQAGLKEKLLEALSDISGFNSMKTECIRVAENYQLNNTIHILLEEL